MLYYNTGMPRLRLPEYGRNIQQMVDYCMTLPDRGERTRCAHAIADIMARLFPELIGEGGDRHKFWDHINIMSDFSLDIDWPMPVVDRESANPRPERVAYTRGRLGSRQYGRLSARMIERIAAMEPGRDRDVLTALAANHLKKQLTVHNAEGVDNARVLADLAAISGGRLAPDPAAYPLNDYDAPAPAQGKKKKKNK